MNLLTESLWGDEGFSAMAIQGSFERTMGIVMRDTSPPWFYISGWLFGKTFGYSEIALRGLTFGLMFFAAVFAGLTAYQIGKSKINGIMTFLLSLFAPFLVSFAFEWRMYALLTFSVMGSTYFLVAKKKFWYVVFSLMALYTHHFGLFTVAAQGLVYLASYIGSYFGKGSDLFKPFGEKAKGLSEFFRWWSGFLIMGLLYIPGVFLTYLQTSRVQDSGFWLKEPKVSEVLNMMYRFLTGGVNDSMKIGVFILVLVLVLTADFKSKVRGLVEISIVYLGPILFAFAVSHLVTPIFYDRYLLSVVMGVMVLINASVRGNYWPFAAVVVAIFFHQSFLRFTNPNKKDFRSFASYVKSVVNEGDLVITKQGREHHLWESKYYGIDTKIYTYGGDLPLFVGTAQMEESDIIKELPEDNEELYLITSDPIEKVEIPDYKRIDEKVFDKDLSLSKWKRVNARQEDVD